MEVKSKIPCCFNQRTFIGAGSLMYYGGDYKFRMRDREGVHTWYLMEPLSLISGITVWHTLRSVKNSSIAGFVPESISSIYQGSYELIFKKQNASQTYKIPLSNLLSLNEKRGSAPGSGGELSGGMVRPSLLAPVSAISVNPFP
jgi:hypothetical protein